MLYRSLEIAPNNFVCDEIPHAARTFILNLGNKPAPHAQYASNASCIRLVIIGPGLYSDIHDKERYTKELPVSF